MKPIVFSLLLLFCHSIHGQNVATRSKSYAKAIQQAKRFVDSLRRKQDIPGISVCVGTKEKMLWAEGFGFADLENKVHVTTDSKFRMGSVSKSLTSAALGKLVEEKKIELDAPIDRYVRNFPATKFSITSRQLATHTAGIRHYRSTDPLNCLKRYETVQDGLAIFSQDTLLFKPGTAYNYSTYGYSLLSAVIEGASQRDFLSYMQTAIFTPLGMNHTTADYSDRIVADRVRFYENTKTQIINAAQVDNSYKWAGGGFLSTPSDLVTFGRSLLNRTILNQETVTLLFTPQLLLDGTNTQYGFGWRLGTDSKGRKIIHHGGTIDGGRTFLMLYPDDNLVVAITANMQQGVAINVPEVEKIAQYFLR